MNAKKLALVAVLALMTVPALTAAAEFSSNSASAVAVEGHSVYVLLDNNAGNIKGFDIAVKVRENFPGGPNVLWFNDRFKTFYPQKEIEPCFGIVYATIHGVPVSTLVSTLGSANLTKLKYVESYRVVLPDDSFLAGAGSHVAITDLYYVPIVSLLTVHNVPVWVTTILGSDRAEPVTTNVTLQDPGCGFWATTVSDADGTQVIPVDADIFGLWRDVIPTGVQIHNLNVTVAGHTLVGTTAAGECTNNTFGGISSSTQGLPGVAGSNCDDQAATPFVGIDTLNGYSHPYGGSHDTEGMHVHQTAALDVFYCGADAPDCGFGLTATPPVPRVFAVDCVAGVQCDPTSVGAFPDGTH